MMSLRASRFLHRRCLYILMAFTKSDEIHGICCIVLSAVYILFLSRTSMVWENHDLYIPFFSFLAFAATDWVSGPWSHGVGQA